MEDSELVSCIITTFNRPNMVDKAIDSVLEQSYKNIEIIVVDDHSSESYAEVITKYNTYSNVIFHRNEKNSGLSASRNRGITLAKGAYVAFLDDDDIWLPLKLAKQVQFLQDEPSFVACSCCHVESETNKIIDRGIRKFTIDDILGVNLLGPPSKIMVRKRLLKNVRFNERAKHAEDWDFYLHLLQSGPIYMLQEPLIIYNTSHFGRMTTGFSSLSIKEIQEKANMTYENRDLIGNKNFRLRMGNYYFAGFLKRKNKLSFLFSTMKEVGFFMSLTILINITRRAIKK